MSLTRASAAVIKTEEIVNNRNRIINGDMRIDQRNAGASVSVANTAPYTLDRWQLEVSQSSKIDVQQNAGSVTPPARFTNYLGVTSTSAYSVLTADYFLLTQSVEGFNAADFGWGTANAETVTISFWVRSSLTGTFGATVNNSAQNRTYPFEYLISVADTWEYKTVTIPGDTSGTWLTNNGVGVRLRFNLGTGATYSEAVSDWTSTSLIFAPTGAVSVVGTSGATFYITGVQLEVGSVATPFERRPYGTELSLCQRYFVRMGDGNSFPVASAQAYSTTAAVCVMVAPQPMRATPTLSHTNMAMWNANAGALAVTALTLNNITVNAIRLDASVASGLVAGNASFLNSGASSGNIQLSAEL